MRQRVEKAAFLVGCRDCALAGILILGGIEALSLPSPDPLQVGGIVALLLSGVLVARGLSVWSLSYARTDVWEMLGREKVNATYAHAMIGWSLKRTYLGLALHAAQASAGMLVVSMARDLLVA